MEINTQVSKKKFRIGWIITIVVGLFLLFDAIIKLIKINEVIEGNNRLGYPENTIFGIGITLLVCTILYLIPRTAVLGAILLTAYQGGATTTHVRVGDPFFFPVVMGILVWLGIYLREKRLHAIVPVRKES